MNETSEPDAAQPTPPPRGPKITDEERSEVLRFAEAGYGTRRIAQRLGRSRKAIRTVLAALRPGPAPAVRPDASKLDPFREYVQEKAAKRLTVSRILRELRERGYAGGRTILADYLRSLRGPRGRKPRVKRRFETEVGKECQIDFSPYRVKLAGLEVTVHAFAAVLHHSRKAYVHLVRDERLSTVLECVVGAFDYFQGASSKLVMDRITAAVFGRVGRDREVLWHPDFLALCKHYGPEPFLCKTRDPDRKGAVEKFFRYLEEDFVEDGAWASLGAMNVAARTWLDQTANVRKHQTTGRVPEEVWRMERDFLIRLPEERFPFWREETRSVADDATLSIAGTHFTVPAQLAPGTVRVRLYAGHFEVVDGEGKVAFRRPYAEGDEKGRLVIDPSHYDVLGWPPQGTEDGRTRQLEGRMLLRFAELGALVEGIRKRTRGAWPLHLAKLAGLARRYGEEAFRQAALRAQGYGAFHVETVRRILEREHPLADEERPVPPARAADRVQLALGDVDGGSLDAYGELDTAGGQDTERLDSEGPPDAS